MSRYTPREYRPLPYDRSSFDLSHNIRALLIMKRSISSICHELSVPIPVVGEVIASMDRHATFDTEYRAKLRARVYELRAKAWTIVRIADHLNVEPYAVLGVLPLYQTTIETKP